MKESISASIVVKDEIAKVVLMPGDPLRAKALADRYLEQVVCFNDTRNMLGFTGTYKGKRISVMGHGMGVPSIGIYSHELFTQFGVEAIIRIGSAGGLAMDVNPMDLVIAQAAKANGTPYRVGKIYTSDFFYYPQSDINEKLRDYGHLCVEMETAGLYWEACACHKHALSLLTISDHLFKKEALSAQERQNSFTDMMRVALETAVRFA